MMCPPPPPPPPPPLPPPPPPPLFSRNSTHHKKNATMASALPMASALLILSCHSAAGVQSEHIRQLCGISGAAGGGLRALGHVICMLCERGSAGVGQQWSDWHLCAAQESPQPEPLAHDLGCHSLWSTGSKGTPCADHPLSFLRQPVIQGRQTNLPQGLCHTPRHVWFMVLHDESRLPVVGFVSDECTKYVSSYWSMIHTCPNNEPDIEQSMKETQWKLPVCLPCLPP